MNVRLAIFISSLPGKDLSALNVALYTQTNLSVCMGADCGVSVNISAVSIDGEPQRVLCIQYYRCVLVVRECRPADKLVGRP